MYEVKDEKIIGFIKRGLLMAVCFLFLFVGIYNFFFAKIGGLIEFILGIVFLFVLPTSFSKHIVYPNQKIIYHNGYWKHETNWAEIVSYTIRKESTGLYTGLNSEIEHISNTKYVKLYNRNGKRLLKFCVDKENGRRLLKDLERERNIKKKGM